jgi:hypothetical protein
MFFLSYPRLPACLRAQPLLPPRLPPHNSTTIVTAENPPPPWLQLPRLALDTPRPRAQIQADAMSGGDCAWMRFQRAHIGIVSEESDRGNIGTMGGMTAMKGGTMGGTCWLNVHDEVERIMAAIDTEMIVIREIR